MSNFFNNHEKVSLFTVNQTVAIKRFKPIWQRRCKLFVQTLLLVDFKCHLHFADLSKHRNFNLLPKSPNCGPVFPKDFTKVMGGADARVGEFPWMVSLYKESKISLNLWYFHSYYLQQALIEAVVNGLQQNNTAEPRIREILLFSPMSSTFFKMYKLGEIPRMLNIHYETVLDK